MGLYEDIEKEAEELNLTINGEQNEENAGDDTSTTAEPEETGAKGDDEDGEGGAEEGSEGGGQDGDGKADQKEPEEELTPSAAAFAKQRREARELKAKLAALEAERAKPAPEAKSDVKATDEEPDRKEDPEAWLAWKLIQHENELKEVREWKKQREDETQFTNTLKSAVDEFVSIENDFKKDKPDYVDAMKVARQTYRNAFMVMNPDLTPQQVEQHIDKQILTYAGQCVQKGLNPAEQLYDLAIERFGYNPNKKAEVKTDKKVVNLKTIDNNRKRSASPLIGGGQGGSPSASLESAADMSLAEFSKLTPSQLRELEMEAFS